MTKIKFTGATAIASNHEALTVGAVGLVVRFEFNSAWDGLHKTAVFHCGGVTKDVLDSSFPANICPIPWECLQEEGETLYCGVYGTDSNGNIIIPSKMARLGTVHPGADPTGDESLDPTLPVWQQALNIAQDAMSLLEGKANAADIPSLEGYATEAYVQSYHDNTKQDIINDLATIRSGAALGATAVQPETGKGLFSGSYNDLTDKPAIPAAVTEGTVSGWGFTKNTGTYSKPTDGIPKSDLANDVQASLGKANTALQEVPIAYRTAAAQDAIDRGKQDKLIAGENITIASDGKTISATGGGASIAMRVDGGHIQYSTDEGKTWVNLIAKAELKGDKGADGKPGAAGTPGIYYGTTQPTGDTHPVWIDPGGDQDDGSLLPVVTATDNGKFLRVVSGAWAAVEISSANGVSF